MSQQGVRGVHYRRHCVLGCSNAAELRTLGLNGVLGLDLHDRDQLLSVTRVGLPKEALEHLLSVLDASASQDIATISWLREKLSYVNVSDSDSKLDAESSEMTLRVATLLVALIGVFQELPPAVEFLLAPHESLDGQPPAKAVFTSAGVNAVNNLVTEKLLEILA